jgi:hypothetical protein
MLAPPPALDDMPPADCVESEVAPTMPPRGIAPVPPADVESVPVVTAVFPPIPTVVVAPVVDCTPPVVAPSPVVLVLGDVVEPSLCAAPEPSELPGGVEVELQAATGTSAQRRAR